MQVEESEEKANYIKKDSPFQRFQQIRDEESNTSCFLAESLLKIFCDSSMNISAVIFTRQVFSNI